MVTERGSAKCPNAWTANVATTNVGSSAATQRGSTAETSPMSPSILAASARLFGFADVSTSQRAGTAELPIDTRAFPWPAGVREPCYQEVHWYQLGLRCSALERRNERSTELGSQVGSTVLRLHTSPRNQLVSAPNAWLKRSCAKSPHLVPLLSRDIVPGLIGRSRGSPILASASAAAVSNRSVAVSQRRAKAGR